MNELQIFDNKVFGEIRTLEIENKIYFVASDVAKALGYVRPNEAILQHCRYTAKHRIPHPQSLAKYLEVNIIPEGDLYRLITHSQLPNAEKFESWVFDEILPSIRKHGAYLTTQKIEEVLLNPDTIIKLATSLKEEQTKRFKLEKQIEMEKPLTVLGGAVSNTADLLLIGEFAKILKQNNVNTGEKRFYSYLRESGYLVKGSLRSDYNLPTQKSLNLGLFRIVETINLNGEISRICKTAKITGKGQRYFSEKFIIQERLV